MDIEGYNLPDDLYYHREHMWARVEGNTATIGITDFAQKLAGGIGFVETPTEADEIKQDDVVGTIETGKWVGKLYAPLSGKVTEINEEIVATPELINDDPYGSGWVFKIEMSDPDELGNLLKGDKAVGWLKSEIAEHVK